MVGHFLKPGGTFFIADFHPVLWMMDDDFTHLSYSYFNDEVIETFRRVPTQTGMRRYRRWNMDEITVFGEIMSSLLKNDMQIVEFKEYPFSPYNCFNNTVRGADGMYRIKNLENKLPMVYSIRARKNK
ncbi:MAG: hypothetical protein ABI237_04885 [Ginsengibacter sp.]